MRRVLSVDWRWKCNYEERKNNSLESLKISLYFQVNLTTTSMQPTATYSQVSHVLKYRFISLNKEQQWNKNINVRREKKIIKRWTKTKTNFLNESLNEEGI